MRVEVLPLRKQGLMLGIHYVFVSVAEADLCREQLQVILLNRFSFVAGEEQ